MQQAINQITMATAAKAVALIVNAKSAEEAAAADVPEAKTAVEALKQIIKVSESVLKNFDTATDPEKPE